MEKQTYTKTELLEKIEKIENSVFNKENVIVYDIVIKEDTEDKVSEFMKNNISEYCIFEHEMEVYDWKVIYNDILIVVDFESNGLYLRYLSNEIQDETEEEKWNQIKERDIEAILRGFAFLQPKFYHSSLQK